MPFRVDESADKLVVRDTPIGLWIFGAVFVTSGLVVLTIPFLSSAWTGFVLWQRAAVVAIGLGHLLAGAFTILRHVETTTSFVRATGNASHVVRRPFSARRHVAEFKMSEVRTVEIRTARDSDGDPMYQLRLWLSGSRVLALQGQPTHDNARVAMVAATLRHALGLSEL